MIYGSLLFRVKMNDVMSIQFQFFHEPFQNRQCVFSSKLPVHDWQNGHYIQQQNETFFNSSGSVLNVNFTASDGIDITSL